MIVGIDLDPKLYEKIKKLKKTLEEEKGAPLKMPTFIVEILSVIFDSLE